MPAHAVGMAALAMGAAMLAVGGAALAVPATAEAQDGGASGDAPDGGTSGAASGAIPSGTLGVPAWARPGDGPHVRALPNERQPVDDPDAPDAAEPPPHLRPTTVGQAALSPTLPVAAVAGWILPPDPTPTSREAQAEQQLDEWLEDQLNGDRLEALGAAPYYHDLMRSMRRAWRPDMGELERHRRAGMNAAQIVADELHRYAQGPQGPGPGSPQIQPEVFNGSSTDGRGWSAVENQMEADNFLNAPVNWTKVGVRVTQSPDGHVVGAWVTSSSGDPAFDQDVLASIRTGALAIPAPPPTVAGAREAIRSDWSFEAGDVATNMNQAGCVDDPVHGGMQCAALGRGIVRTRIRLLRVVDATHDTPEEARAHRQRHPPILAP